VYSGAKSKQVKTVSRQNAATDLVRPKDTGVSRVQSKGSSGQSTAQGQKLSQRNRSMEGGWKNSEYRPMANSGTSGAELSEFR
jgi:hypothetical protein